MEYDDKCICCICGNKIFNDNDNIIVNITLINNSKKDIDGQFEQELFAHLECIKTKMCDKSIIFLV